MISFLRSASRTNTAQRECGCFSSSDGFTDSFVTYVSKYKPKKKKKTKYARMYFLSSSQVSVRTHSLNSLAQQKSDFFQHLNIWGNLQKSSKSKSSAQQNVIVVLLQMKNSKKTESLQHLFVQNGQFCSPTNYFSRASHQFRVKTTCSLLYRYLTQDQLLCCRSVNWSGKGELAHSCSSKQRRPQTFPFCRHWAGTTMCSLNHSTKKPRSIWIFRHIEM